MKLWASNFVLTYTMSSILSADEKFTSKGRSMSHVTNFETSGSLLNFGTVKDSNLLFGTHIENMCIGTYIENMCTKWDGKTWENSKYNLTYD